MARLIRTPMMGWDKFNKTVIGVPESSYEATFDSTLERNPYGDENWTLRITLRIFYRQINPDQLTAPMMRVVATSLGVPVPTGVPVGMYPDSDNDPQFIKKWGGPEWSNFISGVKAQANLWNGKFWLIPPDDFSHFDRTVGSYTAKSGSVSYRPNVKCEFRLEIAPGRSLAHKSIDVVNLLGPGSFRSDSQLYASSDTTMDTHSKPDWRSIVVNTSQPTVAHEIGHALGLPHIGVTRNLAQCRLAIILGKNFHQDTIPALYKGDTNADVCYGSRSAAGDINNIMGAGSSFSHENAKPWLDRLFDHLNLNTHELVKMRASVAKWKISMTDVPPMSLVGFK